MPKGILFWVLMILWLIAGIFVSYPGGWLPLGSNALLWVLLALLGWHNFGKPIQ